MISGLDLEVWNQVYTAAVVLDSISIVCSSFILIVLSVLAFHNHHNVNRISLRLQAGIALIDISNHLNNIFHWVLPDGPACVFNGFYRFFGRQMYCFLNIAIALNLQLIFLNGLQPKPRWEVYYWIVPIIIGLAMNLPPLVLGMFGHDEERCLLKEDTGYDNSALVATNLNSIMLITIIYCVVIATLVMIKLRSNLAVVKSVAAHRHMRNQDKNVMERNIRRLIFRISLYPIACVVSMFGFFIVNILYFFHYHSAFLSSIAMIDLSFTGTINLIAFLLDPTFHNALNSFISEIRKSNKKSNPGAFKLDDSQVEVELSELSPPDNLPPSYHRHHPPQIEPQNYGHNIHLL